ncbi:thioredoxin [archaeon]|nr:thioredoxin [archaeon]
MTDIVELGENLYEGTTQNWEELVIKSEIPVIVDFWAEWCMPCRMMSPVFKETAPEYKGKVKFVKLNSDENRDISIRYGVMSIPTLGIYVNGESIDGVVGAVPKSTLKSKLDAVLQKVKE